jgi:endonuclease YncB( thermonuclease family)
MADYVLIKGSYWLSYSSESGRRVPSQPDRDSVWFKPDDSGLLSGFGRAPRFNGGGFVQLRLEGIDALELHFQGCAQMRDPALAARDELLDLIEFRDVKYSTGTGLSVQSSVPASRAGYILTQGLDAHARPVAFAYVGSTQHNDGWKGHLSSDWMRRSLSSRLLQDGHAYPALYSSLPDDLRTALHSLAVAASGRGVGIWRYDRTNKLTSIPDLDALEEIAIWPKLFRRLVSFFKDGNDDTRDFTSWLLDDPRDRDDAMLVASTGEETSLSDLVHVSPTGRLMMTTSPLDLVITPR